MNPIKLSIGFLFLVLLSQCGSEAKEQQVKVKPNTGKELLKKGKQSDSVVPKEYIVKLFSGTDSGKIRELTPDFKILKIDRIADDTYHVIFEAEPGLEFLVQVGKKSGFVEYVEPNRIYKAF